MTRFKDLVGKKIVGVDINEDKDIIIFTTTDHTLKAIAAADCCAVAWFEDTENLLKLVGHIVLHVSQDDEIIVEGTRQDEDRIYGISLYSTRGIINFSLRNSSNGYYGAWAEIVFGFRFT